MIYKEIEYHKIAESTLIFYEIDNQTDTDSIIFKRMKYFIEIINIEKPKYLILNRKGLNGNSFNNIIDIEDLLVIDNLKNYGVENMFFIESEVDNKISPNFQNNDFVIKLDNVIDVFDYINESVFEKI